MKDRDVIELIEVDAEHVRKGTNRVIPVITILRVRSLKRNNLKIKVRL